MSTALVSTPTSPTPTTAVPLSDVTFVVRSAGERTCAAAVAILRAQLDGLGRQLVHVIDERPFVEAVRRTLTIGRDCGRPFTVGIDADVLLVSQGVSRLASMAAGMKAGEYSAVGLMLCRFFGGYCFRGVHVYRTSMLDEALGLVGAGAPGTDFEFKPESAVVHAMEARGHGFSAHPVVLAVHDYEQSYRHIYLKMRMRGRREAEFDVDGPGLKGFRAVCAEGIARGETDFVVAQWGLEAGVADATTRRDRAPAHYDWFAEWPEFDERMAAARLVEKSPLSVEMALGVADRLVAAHRLDAETRTPAWVRPHLIQRRAA